MSGTQAVTATPVQVPKQPVSGVTKTKFKDPTGRSPLWVRIVLGLICLAWIVPTVGLAITSFRPQDEAATSGWWTIFTTPANFTHLTFENYTEVFQKTDKAVAA